MLRVINIMFILQMYKVTKYVLEVIGVCSVRMSMDNGMAGRYEV